MLAMPRFAMIWMAAGFSARLVLVATLQEQEQMIQYDLNF